MFWIILTVFALIGFLTHSRGPNAVWGTATISIPIGIVIALIQPEWDWLIVGKTVVVGAVIGLILEAMGKLALRRA